MDIRRAALVAASVAAACWLVTGAAPDATAQSRTGRFELNNQPKVSLHHLLIDWALADADEWPFYATPIAERATWRLRLSTDGAREWSASVAAYARARNRSLVFDAGLLALRDYATGGPRDRVPPEDRAMADALDAALPTYLANWWPAHQHRGSAWIGDLAAVLDSVEEEVVRRMELAYGVAWPVERIPVDVVPYANDVGAYSAGGRVTVASADPGLVMPQALEMVFHEASHVDALETPLRRRVEQAFGRAGGEAPDRLWHDLIFYTTGEVIRIVLEKRGLPGYAHYGEATGVYERSDRWPQELAAFDAHWRPFLRAGSHDDGSRRAALEAVARALIDERR